MSYRTPLSHAPSYPEPEQEDLLEYDQKALFDSADPKNRKPVEPPPPDPEWLARQMAGSGALGEELDPQSAAILAGLDAKLAKHNGNGQTEPETPALNGEAAANLLKPDTNVSAPAFTADFKPKTEAEEPGPNEAAVPADAVTKPEPTSASPANKPTKPVPPTLPIFQNYSQEAAWLHVMDVHGDEMDWCGEWDRWVTWNGKHRVKSRTKGYTAPGAAFTMAHDLLRKRYKDAIKARKQGQNVTEKALAIFERQSEVSFVGESVLKPIASRNGIDADVFDADINLMGTPNGVIELDTCTWRPGRKTDMVTLKTAVDPIKGPTDAFDAFMDGITDGDKEKADFILRGIGYAIGGDQHEKVIFSFHGEKGNNGKTFLTRRVLDMLGRDYSATVPTDVILYQKNGDSRFIHSRFRNKRIILCADVGSNVNIDTMKLKNLASGDNLPIENKCIDPTDIAPTHTVFISSNNALRYNDPSNSVKSRVIYVHFPVEFRDDQVEYPGSKPLDDKLKEKLTAELPAIFYKLLQYRKKYLAERAAGHKTIRMPPSVKKENADFQASQNRISGFLEVCCVMNTDARVEQKHLYPAYKKYVIEQDDSPMPKNAFLRYIDADKRITELKSNGKRYFVGVGLLAPVEQPELPLAKLEPPASKPEPVVEKPAAVTAPKTLGGDFKGLEDEKYTTPVGESDPELADLPF